LVSWIRVVLPPSWTLATFGFLYAINETVWMLVGPRLVSDEARWIAALPRNLVVLTATAMYGIFRVLAFHPLARYDYGAWLYLTPWRHPKSLPFGPVHLTAQDLVVAVIGVLLCHGVPEAQLAVPGTFLVTYLSCLCLLCWACGLRWWTYSLVFGLGLVVWLDAWSGVVGTAVALALYPAARAALSASLAGYPWPAAVVRPIAEFMGHTRTKRKQIWFDKSELGWPCDLLQRPVEVSRRNWVHLGVETLLLGWLTYAALSILPSPNSSDIPFFTTMLALVLCGQRLLTYCWCFRPPINLWGRVVTGRWIIPGYDQVLVGPVCVLAIGMFLPIGPVHLGWPGTVSLAVSVAALFLAHRGIGPSFPRWVLTGKHRLVPGITNRQEFEEL
jgi:hypothetical protein